MLNTEEVQALTLRVGIVQVESQPGRIEANHARATPMVEQAARRQARVVVLPELFACGYVPNQSIWGYAESMEGPTVTWLCETSRRLEIYLGAGLIETDGGDFFNTFVMTDPDGLVAGRARKAMAEPYCFRRDHGSHFIDTELGTFGIGICADNHFSSFHDLIGARSVDLMIMPHASPLPHKTSKLISAEDVLRARKNLLGVPALYAASLGVPVVFANAVGALEPMAGLVGKLIDPAHFRLQGLSRIIDSDGTLKGSLDKEEGVLVSDVMLDPSRKHYSKPEDFSGWLHPGSTLVRKVIMPMDVALGTASYRMRPQPLRQSADECR